MATGNMRSLRARRIESRSGLASFDLVCKSNFLTIPKDGRFAHRPEPEDVSWSSGRYLIQGRAGRPAQAQATPCATLVDSHGLPGLIACGRSHAFVGPALPRLLDLHHAGLLHLLALSAETLIRSLDRLRARPDGLPARHLAPEHAAGAHRHQSGRDEMAGAGSATPQVARPGPGPHANVEFVARSKLAGRAQRLHEASRFVREGGRWFYVDGKML